MQVAWRDGIGLELISGSLTTGSSLLLNSTSAAPENGIARIIADGMTAGKALLIEAPDITSGTVLDIQAAQNDNNNIFHEDGKIVNIVAGPQANAGGTIVDITANSLTNGTILSISGNSLTGSGRAIKVSSSGAPINEAMVEFEADDLVENGRALYVHSNSSNEDYRSLVEIENKNSLSEKTQVLRLVQSATTNGNPQTQNPPAALAIESLIPESLYIRVSSTNQADGAQITLARDRRGSDLNGNINSVDAVQTGDTIGRISFDAFTSSTRQTVGTIESIIDNPSVVNSNNIGSKLVLKRPR